MAAMCRLHIFAVVVLGVLCAVSISNYSSRRRFVQYPLSKYWTPNAIGNRLYWVKNTRTRHTTAHIFFHGDGTAVSAYPSLCNGLIDRDDMLYVSPQSSPTLIWTAELDDTFVVNMTRQLTEQRGITDFILSGHSMGAEYVEYMVCAGTVHPIRAAVSYSDVSVHDRSSCVGDRVPILLLHGANDEGGSNGTASMRSWSGRNGCSGIELLRSRTERTYVGYGCVSHVQMHIIVGQSHFIAQPTICQYAKPWIDATIP